MASTCSSDLVMSLVIILLALHYSTANCHQGNLGIKMEKDVFLHIEHDTTFNLGRKMLQEMNGKPGQFSGNLDSSSPQVQAKNNYSQDQEYSEKSISVKNESITEKEGSESFLEADDEVATLMRKDYRGTARRRPPINNHEPNN